VQTAEKLSEAHFGKLFSVMKGKKSVLFDDSLKLNAIIAPFWIVDSAKLKVSCLRGLCKEFYTIFISSLDNLAFSPKVN